jgi:hypothetical protein
MHHGGNSLDILARLESMFFNELFTLLLKLLLNDEVAGCALSIAHLAEEH